MAGGEGTRLRPMTSDAHCAALSSTVIMGTCRLLQRHGYGATVVTVGSRLTHLNYWRRRVRHDAALRDGRSPLGTAGSVGTPRKRSVTSPFLVISVMRLPTST